MRGRTLQHHSKAEDVPRLVCETLLIFLILSVLSPSLDRSSIFILLRLVAHNRTSFNVPHRAFAHSRLKNLCLEYLFYTRAGAQVHMFDAI